MNIETQGLDFLCQYKKAITTTKGNENATQKGNIKNIIEKKPLKSSYFKNWYSLGIYPKNAKSLPRKSIYTPMFTAAIFTAARTWEQRKSIGG